MNAGNGDGDGDGREWPSERLNRNYADLLQELRVAQTGNQILFAFLLTVAFTERFSHATEFQRIVYVITLLFTVAASTLMIAPVAHHRVLFRQGQKDHLVIGASRFAMAGLFFLMLGVCGALFLAVDVIIGAGWATGLTISAVVVHIGLWYLLPMWRRVNDDGGT